MTYHRILGVQLACWGFAGLVLALTGFLLACGVSFGQAVFQGCVLGIFVASVSAAVALFLIGLDTAVTGDLE